jgi:hypothetical protein
MAAWQINLEKKPCSGELELARDRELWDSLCDLAGGGPSVHPLAVKCGTYSLLRFAD